MLTLMERLPAVRGSYRENADLSKYTWFNVGGPADVVFKPADVEDLCDFLKARPKDVSVTVFGAGSNTMIRDGGVEGVVIRLGRGFNYTNIDGDNVMAGAATLNATMVKTCQPEGLGGLEFLIGVPGSVGGAVAMNAGCYGKETAGVLVSVKAVDWDGEIHTIMAHKMGLAYRTNPLRGQYIFVEATFRCDTDAPESILEKMNAITEQREEAQPKSGKTGGSTFKNPDGAKAWELIDAAGARDIKVGGAHMSEKHCNFMMNDGTASAADLEALGEQIRKKVKAHSGVELEWEIERVGRKI